MQKTFPFGEGGAALAVTKEVAAQGHNIQKTNAKTQPGNQHSR
jgi:hypothetical protein